jgi:NitT/TauT family transport system substrate-binding protein
MKTKYFTNKIFCDLTVRDELINENPALVQDLVDYVLGAGVWLDQQPAHRYKAVEIASGRSFFNQDKKILKFVMDNPADRVTYGDLRMVKSEFDELMQLSVEAGTLKQPVAYERYVTEAFARQATAVPLTL